ncbi:type IV secretory system conjugative DNA transfer family protein [Pseudovibrio sp. Tun.PSC04-5.I4]|uniref:type IV secretory system conjugative DNA transfer family protein n=1 Tax=Pseudovibrio sp. Tun.PSC04-5.I4 TaxID=1798213 RepID=UPI00088FE71E|nr:type IV secretory system conjugative DNA transfer family protein [Pseudovibrio sp. Tun.PSC04-5.I4]SDR45085.1 type IV secretion system protein VirD4 [Pseudovibrio sp. Tun.PSC04-5.I4]
MHIFPRIVALISIFAFIAVTLAGWYYTLEFDPTNMEWWKWLYAYYKQTNELPNTILIPFGGGFVAMILVMIAGRIVMEKATSSTVSGGRDSESLHGTARFAKRKEVEKMGLLRDKGVVVGGFEEKNGSTSVLRHNGPEHVFAFAPTRSGKGVGVVVPTLLTWPGSTIVLDIKGENYAKTSGWRASQGQNVFYFEPTAMEGSARYNPLGEVRIDTDFQVGDCMNVAKMIVDTSGKGLKDFWEQEGFSWLSTAILHVLYRIRNEEERTASLGDVLHFLSVGDDEAAGEASDKLDALVKAKGKKDEDGFEKLLLDMESYEHNNKGANTEVRRGASRMRKRSSNERSGVSSTATAQLAIFADPIIARNTSACDFTIDDLMNADQPTNVYLVLSPAEIGRMKALIRIILNQMLTRLTSKMSHVEGETLYKHRMLLMLDEFPQLGKLDIFESSLAFMAGYGLKAFLIAQDITQLQSAYTREESIISNCHIRIAYAPNKIETAKVLSDMAGKTTVVQRKRSVSKNLDRASSTVSESISEVARPLMTPDECMLLPKLETDANDKVTGPGKMLIFAAGEPTIYGQQYLYFQDEELNARSKFKPSGNIKNGAPVGAARAIGSKPPKHSTPAQNVSAKPENDQVNDGVESQGPSVSDPIFDRLLKASGSAVSQTGS